MGLESLSRTMALHEETQLLAEPAFSKSVRIPHPAVAACWTYKSAAIASLLLSLSVFIGVGVHLRRERSRPPAFESLYKFGQVADFAHYQASAKGLCSKSAPQDNMEALPIAEPSIRPRLGLCKSGSESGKLLPQDFPCNFSKTWSCPSFGADVKANASGVATADGSLGYHCCCEVDRPRSVTWSRHPFQNDNEVMPVPQTVRIKVVTYNIFWWSLFGVHHGNNGTAGGVIATSMVREPIDLIAFQECRDKDRVLHDAGLLRSFHTFGGKYEKCIALNKDAWVWLQEGEEDVAADTYWNDFGPRGVMWARVWHRASGLRVFFANFHGPLAINSGGDCGGFRTARNILKVIREKSEFGDIVILAGDFNANPASSTIQELRKSLTHALAGRIFAGIDNIFSNLAPSSVVAREDLGTGGSDHHALATVFEVHTGGYLQPMTFAQEMPYTEAILAGLRTGFPKDDWIHFWCGLEASGVSYNPLGGSGRVIDKKVSTPDHCCRECQRSVVCRAFRFEGIPGSNTTRCTLMSTYEIGEKDSTYTFVASGLAAEAAIEFAERTFRAYTPVTMI
ncbi:unnamed protein product [Symbiodinium natans]|uniref:Endonuclease/exonuclease/phosphatase domain-containing protein n=1 Tax=Symbiodinium natans TaxID=878477 RepID=A0A812GMH8_9DINO|nr:unnamed protein product [Symbiodinium natans]